MVYVKVTPLNASVVSVSVLALLASEAVANSPFLDCTTGPLSRFALCDSSKDVLTRASSLVAAMTLEEKINNTQYDASGVSRLGLLAYNWWSEGLHGVAGFPGVYFAESGPFSYANSFPSPIVLGSMFDDDLVGKR